MDDTSVLKPEWLADGIYALLRANRDHKPPLASGGVLDKALVGKILKASAKLKVLKAKDYPETKWEFLLRLMEIFELSFPVDDACKRVLVPNLLPVSEPPGCEEPAGKDVARMSFRFKVVPAPMMPRLLVKLFAMTSPKHRWQRGTMMQYGEARAKLWELQDEPRICVTVQGSLKLRQMVMRMVRERMEDELAGYKELWAEEEWWDVDGWTRRAVLERTNRLPAEATLAEADTTRQGGLEQ